MADRTTRYKAKDRKGNPVPGVYFRLNAAGRGLVAEGKAPDDVPDKHRVYVVGYRDSARRQRWQTLPPGSILKDAKHRHDEVRVAKHKGEKVHRDPKLKFAKAAEKDHDEAAEKWLESLRGSNLAERTIEFHRTAVENHLAPRWGGARLFEITDADAAQLVIDMRGQGLSEWTISAATRTASRVFRYAKRYLGYGGEDPFALLEPGERARVSQTPRRRIYSRAELEQVLAGSPEPWRTLFVLASVVGARLSELLALWWEDVDLSDFDRASVRFACQVDRYGNRVENLKTDASQGTLSLPRATAAMLAEHRARSLQSGPRAFVFASRNGNALSQRNVLRALYRAQELARTPEGVPTFPDLFVHDERGHLAVDASGAYVPNRTPRRQLPPLPDFHSFRHGAAMACDDAEEARDLLRHKDTHVTMTVYRSHFDDRRRESLRAKLEARHAVAAPPSEPAAPAEAVVVPISRAAKES